MDKADNEEDMKCKVADESSMLALTLASMRHREHSSDNVRLSHHIEHEAGYAGSDVSSFRSRHPVVRSVSM